VNRADRLRVAVQKSGRLAQPSQDLLAECGLAFRQSRDKLFCFGETLPIDLLLVRDDDIPRMLAEGTCDLGIVGRNVLAEQDEGRAPVAELRALGFGACRLAIALPQDLPWEGPASLAGLRIATSYPRLLRRYLDAAGVTANVVVLNGSVEIAPRLGTADAVCDLVSSGATLAANQLREVAVVTRSEAVLAGGEGAPLDARTELRGMLLRRIEGVLAVKDSKLVLLHAPRDALGAVTRLLPGSPRTLVTSVEGAPDEVAVQALCPRAVTWQHLEDLKRAGAHSLLVLPVEKVLA
jgi:ATP phosphoribosyltransferase